MSMKRKTAMIVSGLGILVLSLLISNPLWSQTIAAFTGTVTDTSGKPVPDVNISIQDMATGHSAETETNAAGVYTEPNLTPGEYKISASANGFRTQASEVTLTAAREQRTDFVLSAGSAQETPANQLPAAPQPNAPKASSGNANALSLQSLGFSSAQTQGSAQEQARLNKRTHMLKIHQTLGLITLAPMVATIFTGGGAKAKRSKVPGSPVIEPSSANLDLHVALGATTGALYAATAYYAIFAPKIPGVKPKGAIRIHRDLAWVHGPGMLLTGIMGIDAYRQENAGEKVHGFASAHGTVAGVTLAAYAASIVAVSWPIHWKFWER
jgi:Carboxypeptidase regulatory-like domain